MLSPENLAGVDGLTPEQQTQILDLSKKASAVRDKTVAGEATKAAYDSIDAAIKQATGKEKPGGVFTSNHLNTVLNDLTQSAKGLTDLKTKYGDLEGKYKTLQDQKAGSADTGRVTDLEKELEASRTKFSALEKKYSADSESWKTKNDAALKENDRVRTAAVVDRALENFTYRDDLDPDTIEIVRGTTRQKLMDAPRQWVKGKDGKEMLVFLDEGGLPINDPKTVTPATADFLAAKTLKGVTVQSKQAAGNGSGAQGGTASGEASGFSLDGVGSKIEANNKLSKFIDAKGLQPASKEWQAAFDKIHDEVIAKAELPMYEPAGV